MLDITLVDGTTLTMPYASAPQRVLADKRVDQLRKLGLVDAVYVVSEWI